MDIADVFVILKPIDQWTSADSKEELINKIKVAISIVPGVNFEFTQPIEMRFNELLTGVREDVAIKLFGEDLEVLSSKAEEMGELIKTVPGVADMKVEATEGLPQITINYNRSKLAQYGLAVNNLNNVVQAAFAGGKAGVIFEGEKRFDLIVRLQQDNRKSIDDIQNVFINTPNGAQIPLREIADISYESGPMQISRDNTNRRTYVGINIRDRDVKSVVMDIQDKLNEEFDLPPGYYIRYGGAFENLERASSRLQTVVPIALLLIFILIYFALKSFPQTLMIYLAIPMATIGGVFALWLRDMPFSISAGVGFIVLFGVAVLNGLVMISGLNELKEEGVTNLKDRIIQGTKRRIRPIMLTAFTDILGFLPMAISSSAGAEVQRPLATVVIGGLLTSTLLTLFILPIFYQWVEKRSGKFQLNKKYTLATATTALLLFLPVNLKAQQTQDSLPQISLEQAIKLAQENYPLLKTKKLEIEKQQQLKSSAYDLGNTQIFTGGEELDNNGGIYTTIGFSQTNIDLFSIGPSKRLNNQRMQLAETAYDLSQLKVEQEVKKAWSQTLLAKRRNKLYVELDSIYSRFKKAVELNFEVEAISRLEYSSAINQALQIQNKMQQAARDYSIALQGLNLWLVSETFFTVTDVLNEEAFSTFEGKDLTNHPEYKFAQKEIQEAEANYDLARAELLPKFNLQAGLQEVNGNSGFYTYQAGISIPLLSGPSLAKKKAAKLDTEIAQENSSFKMRQIKSEYNQAQQEFQKWKISWHFYSDEALPLAKEQRSGALTAYNEGALDYAAFSQIISAAVQTEIDALDALSNYLKALYKIQYYTSQND
tara:strand:+ start:2 stop:2479 length:2478 start_codon:yes stop_codon:yes gene_type:complete